MLDDLRGAIVAWGGNKVRSIWSRIGYTLAIGSPFIMFINLKDGIGALVVGVCLIAASRSKPPRPEDRSTPKRTTYR